MKTALRKTLKISGIVLGAVVLLGLAAVLLVLFDKPLVRNIIQSRLSKGVGSTARLGRLDYSVFPFRVTIESLELGQEDAFQKLSVSVTRLEARGSFWKLVRGVKPALDAIEADGVSFRLEQKAVSEKPLDIEKGPHPGLRHAGLVQAHRRHERPAVDALLPAQDATSRISTSR